jgi:hypothetical protein
MLVSKNKIAKLVNYIKLWKFETVKDAHAVALTSQPTADCIHHTYRSFASRKALAKGLNLIFNDVI